MTLHVANEMDEVEVAVWWDLSRIVRHFERQGLARRAVKAAVMNAALRLMKDEGTNPQRCDWFVNTISSGELTRPIAALRWW